MNSNNWFFIYHDTSEEGWSTPKGFALALEKEGINLFKFRFSNPKKFSFPEKEFFIKNNITVAISFYAGKCLTLEKELLRLKKELGIYIICELGDEPQTLISNSKRVSISDISLSPDHQSSLYWKNQKYNCIWFTHWADSSLYVYNPNFKKKILIGTSMGRRKHNILLKILFGNSYINKRCTPLENAKLYQQSKIVFQYARWNEITRRIFEAAACKCCIVTNRLPEHTHLETIFAHNVSAIYYDNTFSLIYHLIRLIFKPNLRETIAKNAFEIVHKHHTQISRAKELIRLVNLKNNI